MKISDQFLEAYRTNERERVRLEREIKERFDAAEALLLQAEEERLQNLLMESGVVTSTRGLGWKDDPPGVDFRVGDRVWCSKFKCMGTITDFEVSVDCWDDDYYSQWRVNTPKIGVSARIQPDPTPIHRRAREVITSGVLQLSKGGPSYFLSSPTPPKDWGERVE